MLTILIPTYNRVEFLTKNLISITEIVTRGGFNNDIDVIISDNCSPDNTFAEASKFKDAGAIRIELFRQPENIGLKANALFVLEKSTAEYIMYLGDDDFISDEYLYESLEILKSDTTAYCIIPNYVPVTVENKIKENSRDFIGPSEKHLPGFHSVHKNSWKGHQLSGLILKREGLLDEYIKHGVNNIYPFIFFVSISMLKGSHYLIKDHPVRVVQPIKKKDWGYGKDGLINEIFDNYRHLPISPFKRYRLESRIFYIQDWRLFMYKKKGTKEFCSALVNIGFAKNASFLFTLLYPFLILKIVIKRKFFS